MNLDIRGVSLGICVDCIHVLAASQRSRLLVAVVIGSEGSSSRMCAQLSLSVVQFSSPVESFRY